jgi:putative endonuclease
MDTKELGDLGEKLACEYLVRKGYNIVSKNYRINFGEIDIIVKKKWRFFVKNDKTIHFVEVKTSFASGGNFFPEERVNHKKQSKLKKLAEIWLEQQKMPQDFPYQIDAIAVLIDNKNKKAQIKFFNNITSENV